jgi:hypothetical protein
MLQIITVVLHPRHKLKYFTNAGWSDEWISTARGIVHDAYESSYKCFLGDEALMADGVHVHTSPFNIVSN